MSYTPALPLGGYAGWVFLKRTMATQKAAFAAAPDLKSDEAYFHAKIGTVKTADDLVKDRRLLKVALGAYGLDADINNTYFIKKVLQDGTLTTSALANKLSDKQYQKFSSAFGFGDYAVPSTQLSDFPDKILAAYESRQFEIAVGAQDSNLRLALNAQRELTTLAGKSSSENAKWYTVLGNSPLRKVFEKALGLPTSIGALDLEQQMTAFKDKATSQLGSNAIAQFTDPDKVEALVRRFLLRSEAESYAQSGNGNSALQMMQQIVANGRQRLI